MPFIIMPVRQNNYGQRPRLPAVRRFPSSFYMTDSARGESARGRLNRTPDGLSEQVFEKGQNFKFTVLTRR